ncbi:MarP family serine protease [Corynebacterium godavarianum]|uniref:MarP family serine protease n=1 Tax=Corynebacterium godavarianum TaxID=2054421 RepID=A0ABY3E591_9CORY|nr:MarP family serine protease [Corynebacterium godavarianum]MBL7284951.1 MarP family serine protease [Corynebacterium godavarianum]TSJ74844.1 MarP family serine protease [Corynebacterium godavarianum]
MTGSAIVDLVAAILVVGSFAAGWRRGVLASVFIAVGSVAGLIVGLLAAAYTLDFFSGRGLRVIIFLAVVVFFVGLGNLAGSAIGDALRGAQRWRPMRVLDSVVGALLQALAMSLALWLVSIPLVSALPEQQGAALRDSRVLRGIDTATPDAWAQLPAKAAALLHDTGLPPLVSPLSADAKREVDAPDESVVTGELVDRVRPSVVHVVGDSETCHHRLMGSGFVIADGYVLTNAHVVAGTQLVNLDTVLGVKHADVVLYDPEVDIAVLHAPELGLPELTWAPRELKSGDDAVVMGFPESGPFEADAVRVRTQLELSGPDIYATGRVERGAYTIRGDIRQGNSGGPMFTPEGQVAGMIFGTDVDVADTGYALTGTQLREVIGDVERLTDPVDTQTCAV